jgi:SAM-dependent methyltransferase
VLDRPGLTKIEAELYALTHRGQRGDAELYAGQCAGVGRVLELGTGYGRLLGPLSAAAAEVVGLDRDPELLAAARRQIRSQIRGPMRGQGRRVRLVEGDFTSFQLPGTFDRIVLPYNALYCLLGRRALLRCFARVRAHLAAGGQFLFDVWSADAFQRSTRRATRRAGHRDDSNAIVSLHHRGQVWDVFEHSRLRSARQRLDVLYTYVPRSRGARVQIRIEQRYAPWAEIAALLAEAGLQVRARYGGFARERWSPRSDQLVVIAEPV